MYTDQETGKTLLELHKNQSGKGIPKFLKSNGKEPALIDIIEGPARVLRLYIPYPVLQQP